MKDIQSINKMPKEEKIKYLKDINIKREYFKKENHYEFIWLVQELQDDILLFLDDDTTNMLKNDPRLEDKLNAIITSGNPLVNKYLKEEKLITLINQFHSLDIYLTSLNIEFGINYFNYIIKNNCIDCFSNLNPHVQLEILKDKKNLDTLKSIDLPSTFLTDINVECIQYLLKDNYFENIFLNLDIFEIDKMVKKGLIIPNNLIEKRLINKYLQINDINILYDVLSSLELNNSHLLEYLTNKIKDKFKEQINNIDRNLGIFKEYKDLITSLNHNNCNISLYLKLQEVNNQEERLKILQDYTTKTMLEMTILSSYNDLAYNFLKNINIIINYINNNNKNHLIPKERLDIYNKLHNYYTLSIEDKINLFNTLITTGNISTFYDDFKSCLNDSYQSIKDTCFKIDKNKTFNVDNLPIYKLDGEKFKMLINHTTISRYDDCHPYWSNNKKYISTSLIGDTYLGTFRNPQDNVILGFTDFNIENIMHMYESDSYSSKEYGSAKIPTIDTPDNLLSRTKAYNEILIKGSNELKPSYIVCYDSIKEGDIITSKYFNNIPLVIINTKKYNTTKTSINIDIEHNRSYIEPSSAYLIDTYKRKS